MTFLSKTGLIICTRNREGWLRGALQSIINTGQFPNYVVIVDSSDVPITSSILPAGGMQDRFTLLRTDPGLPRQRLAGVRKLRQLDEEINIIFFMDDDVRIHQDFFQSAIDIFLTNKDALLVSGWDVNRPHLSRLQEAVWSLFGYRNEESGALLKSGVGIVPLTKQSDVAAINLHAGLAFAVRRTIDLESHFNLNIRMTGEDVDFFLRGEYQGRAFSGKRLGVEHLESVDDRQSIRARQARDMAFRRDLAEEFPLKVHCSSIFIWEFLELLYFLLGIYDQKRRQQLLGFFDFWRARVVGQSSRDWVEN